MRYISTTDANITFTDTNGKVMVVPKNRVYTHFNVDTITFLLIERYDNEGICIFTTMAEDLQINGTTYTYEQLLDGEGISDLFSPTGLSFEIVEELPETGSDGVIYLVPNGEDSYTEYLWIANEQRYEMLGDVGDIDLTNYYTKSEVDALIPTNVSDLTNDVGYITQTAADSVYATQVVVNEEIAARIAGDGALNTALGTKADKSDTYTKTQVDDALALKQDASTAFSGDYDDLTNKPDLSVYAESADLATVATSGDYDDLSNKPTIPVVPTNVSAFTNDAGYLTEHQSLDNYYTKTQVDTALAAKVSQTEFDTKEEVISTALNELEENKQNKLTAGANITIDANNVISSTGGTQIQADWTESDTTDPSYIQHKPTLATVATSGDYNDLSNKPTIPDTSDFVTKAEYNPKEVAIANALTDLNESKADKSEIPVVPDMTNYYTKTETDNTFVSQADFDVKEEVISTALNTLNTSKADTSSVYTKTEIDAMIGNINTILASI